MYIIGSQPTVNYRNWVMGSFDLGNGLFFLLFNILLRINWYRKTDPNVALINDNCQIKTNG